MVISSEQIKKDLKSCSSIRFTDSFYILPALDYITEEFLPWFRSHLQRRRMVYTKERFDCDDFMAEFASCLKEAGLHLKEEAGIAVATMHVNNLGDSLGVGKGPHGLNLIGVKTKDGHDWLVVEPQNQKYVFLEDYTGADDLRVFF